MKPHEQRVVEEKKELDIKLDKLTEFMKGDIYSTVSAYERSRLYRQYSIMREYSAVLAERIVHFSK